MSASAETSAMLCHLSSPLGTVSVVTHSGKILFAGLGEKRPVPEEHIRRYVTVSTLKPASSCPVAKVTLQRWLSGQPIDKTIFHLNGTPLQNAVWEALCTIPAGETISYSQLAIRAGYPTAIRAAASACGANPIAPFIPCHRVLRKSGELGGYGWGIPLKEKLLKWESDRQTKQPSRQAA